MVADSSGHRILTRRRVLKYGGVGLATGLAGCAGGDGGDGGDGDGSDGGDGGGQGPGPTVAGNGGGDLPLIRWGSTSGGELGTTAGLFAMPEFQAAIPDDVMPNVGEKYRSERTATRGSAPAASAMGAGELDGGSLAFSSTANAITEDLVSGGLSVVLPQVWVGPDLPFNIPYSALDGSGIESVDDLPGTNFAVNAKGGTSDVAARVHMRRNGIDPEQDLNMREVGFGAMGTALQEGRIDVGTFVQPLWENIQSDAHVVFDQGDVFGNYLTLFGTATNEFLEESPDVMRWFLEDNWEATKWMTDPNNRDQVVDILSELLGLPADLLETTVPGAERAYYIGQDGYKMEGRFIQPGVDAMVETGYLQDTIDMGEYVTNDYIPDDANQFPPFIEG